MKIKDVIDKLSSYNLYNYLFPGFVFVMILNKTTSLLPYNLTFDFINIVLIYFTGLVISRIGSLIIEGILAKRLNLGEIDTSILIIKLKTNVKFEVIFEVMNMYRTIAAMLFLLTLMTLIDLSLHHYTWLISLLNAIAEVLLATLFTFAYCKQRKKVLQCLPEYDKIKKTLFKKSQKRTE
jgi:hypothetical protein